MLRFFHSIFSAGHEGGYPESLVKEAIERAVDGTDSQLRAVSGYRKKLRPAVIRAIDHVVGMVNLLSPPMPVSLGTYGDDPRIKCFFISATHMKKVLREDRSLAGFVRGSQEGGSSRIFALMAMEKQEKVVFGAGLSGEIVVKDVPQVTVSFDGHRFLDPAGDETETRRHLMRRAYDHLLSLALRRLTALKWERHDLERRRTLLHAKLHLLEREGWGFESPESEGVDVAASEERLAQIEAQLEEFGGDEREFETYLETVVEVLERPEEYLRGRNETIFVDRMGIKRSEAATDAPELNLSVLENAEGRRIVVTLVSFRDEELRADLTHSDLTE